MDSVSYENSLPGLHMAANLSHPHVPFIVSECGERERIREGENVLLLIRPLDLLD